MRVIGLKTPRMEADDPLAKYILESSEKEGGFEDKDVLVVASSAVATVQGRTRKLEGVEPTKGARELAREAGLDERFTEIVLQESDEILGTGEECLLARKDGMLLPNAGVDRRNVSPGQVLLMPKNPSRAAKDLRKRLEDETGKQLGVIIADSHVQPLRIGTVGQAVEVSGIAPVMDCRGQFDLYGQPLHITFRAIADQLASAAQIVMGESDESVPAAIVRGADVAFSETSEKSIKISSERDIYSDLFRPKRGSLDP